MRNGRRFPPAAAVALAVLVVVGGSSGFAGTAGYKEPAGRGGFAESAGRSDSGLAGVPVQSSSREAAREFRRETESPIRVAEMPARESRPNAKTSAAEPGMDGPYLEPDAETSAMGAKPPVPNARPSEPGADSSATDAEPSVPDAKPSKPEAEPLLPNAQPAVPEAESSMLLVALGDSIALGVGDEEGGGFMERLRGGLEALQGGEVRTANLAVNGIRSDELLAILLDKEQVRNKVAEAGMIAVSIGGNDLARVVKKNALELSMDRFEEGRTRFGDYLAEIVDFIYEENESADIYLLGLFNPLSAWFSDIPELADIFDGWNRTIREVAGAHDRVYFVPVEDLFADGDPEDYTAEDFIHPNGAGYDLIAGRMLDVITAAQSQGDEDA